jgi:cytochrome c biogenesis protein CcmG/thiol:disulfide interchange protein DsbE
MWRALIPLIVFALIGALLWSGIGNDPTLVPSPLVGKPAPDFSAPVLNEPQRSISKQDLLGQPYLLNVFASWCPACRVEHPVLNDYAQRGELTIYGLNYKDLPEDANRWLAQFGNPYAGILVDPEGRVGLDFGVYGAPETFVIDAQGTIVYKHIGPLTPADIETKIKPLLRGDRSS